MRESSIYKSEKIDFRKFAEARRRGTWANPWRGRPFSKKTEKSRKRFAKGLDKSSEKWYNNGAVNETASRSHRKQAGPKKTWKSFEKPLDKRKRKWYNKQVAETELSKRKPVKKKLKKSFEKPLDKGKRMWYNKQAAEKAASKIAHWKLNNNVLKRLRKFFWIYKSS